MLPTRILEGTNELNATHPQTLYPICASNPNKTPIANSSSYGNINSAGCPFPGSSNNTEFTHNSTPQAIT